MRLRSSIRGALCLVFCASSAIAQEAPATGDLEPRAEPGDASAPTPPPPGDEAPVEPTPEPAPVEPAPATPPAPAPTPTPEPEKPAEQAPPLELRPFATDTRGGHFVLGASAGFVVPFGEVSREKDFFSLIDVGFGAGADIGYGVSRHLVVGTYGELQLHGDASACVGCSASSLGVGAFVRYYLVQGLRFDPWISYGIGYRGLNVTTANDASLDYAGLEWLRLQVGGDWYALSQLAFGPYLELGAASFFDVPDGERRRGVNWRFQSGVRITFDFPGK